MTDPKPALSTSGQETRSGVLCDKCGKVSSDHYCYFDGGDGGTFHPSERRVESPKISIEVYQQDFMPGFAAFRDDGEIQENAKAHVMLNVASFMAVLEMREIHQADLPYVIAESLMHEVIHCFESWAKVEFNEERVEALLRKYHDTFRPNEPIYEKCEPRGTPEQQVYAAVHSPAVQALESQWIRVEDRLPELNKDVLVYMPKYSNNPSDCVQVGCLERDSTFSGEIDCGRDGHVTHWLPRPAPPVESLSKAQDQG